MPEDAALLRRYADNRAEDAFAELVRRHVDAVYSSALRRLAGDTHLAEDVTQQVFVALARRAEIVARHPALTSWLHVATRHAAANAVRTERRRRAREQATLTMPDSPSDPSATADWSRVAPLIDAAIDRLDDRDRTAVLLRFIESRSYSDIASTLQLTEDAARRRVDRALEKLRVSLARRGIASTSAALGLALANHAVAAAPAGLATTATSLAVTTAASTATASTLGFLQFMTATKLSGTALAAAALLVVSLGTATYELTRAHAATAALLAARAEDSALATRLRALNDQATAAEREAATLAQQLRDAETAAAESARLAAAAAAAAAKAAAWNPAAEGTAFMQRHPAVRQALADWFDGRTNYRFSAFYEQAGLTADQIRQFLALNRQGSFGMGSGPTSPYLQFQLMPREAWSDADRNIAALLGPEKFQQYQRYLSTLPAREFTAQLAASLTFSPEPLTAVQFAQFTQALGSGGGIQLSRTGPTYDWAIISQAAAPTLSPAQREALAALRFKAEFDDAYSRAADAANHSSP